MRTYEEIRLRDLIDETFGPAEYEVDRILYHHDAEAILESTTAEIYDRDDRIEPGTSLQDKAWIVVADEWPNEDEPDECKLE